MKKIKDFWNRIKKWFRYWFFYRPLIKRLLKSKGVSNRSRRNHFIDIIYQSIYLNERMMGIDKDKIKKLEELLDFDKYGEFSYRHIKNDNPFDNCSAQNPEQLDINESEKKDEDQNFGG